MTESGLEGVDWPVLRFGSPNCSMLRYDVPAPLVRASGSTLRTWRRMKEYLLVDSSGMRHDLRDPRLVEETSRVRGMILNVLGTKSQVQWRVETTGPLTVETIRRLIEEDMERYPTVWQAYDIDTIREQLEGVQTVRDVFAVFGGT